MVMVSLADRLNSVPIKDERVLKQRSTSFREVVDSATLPYDKQPETFKALDRSFTSSCKRLALAIMRNKPRVVDPDANIVHLQMHPAAYMAFVSALYLASPDQRKVYTVPQLVERMEEFADTLRRVEALPKKEMVKVVDSIRPMNVYLRDSGF